MAFQLQCILLEITNQSRERHVKEQSYKAPINKIQYTKKEASWTVIHVTRVRKGIIGER